MGLLVIAIIIITLLMFRKERRKISAMRQDAEEKLERAQTQLHELEDKQKKAHSEIARLLKQKGKLNSGIAEIIKKTDELHEVEKTRLIKLIESTQTTMNTASNNYFKELEEYYLQQEQMFDKKIIDLSVNYEEQKSKYASQINATLEELSKLQTTRNAIIAAQLKEQEIKDKLSFYCLHPRQDDLNDIQVLEEVKKRLRNPRVLSMLIWSTYFQKDMATLCNNVLGTKTITGIYKITNQTNNKCYIGQSVDVSKRWKDHAKCGLGIDTPVGNKLYKEMQEVGIWNFSWELLEECSKEDLNEKERFYIDLYKSKEYGYNTLKGVH